MPPNPRSSRPAERKAAKNQRPVPTFDHLRAKKPIRIPHWVPMDDGAASQLLADARRELGRAEMMQQPERLDVAKAAVAAAEENLRQNSVRMLFSAVGRYEFEALVAEHPPTDDQREQMRRLGQEAEYNHDTLAAPLVAMACIEPKLTLEQVMTLQYGVTKDDDGSDLDEDDERYIAPWNQAEFAALFQAALRACTSRRDADLGF